MKLQIWRKTSQPRYIFHPFNHSHTHHPLAGCRVALRCARIGSKPVSRVIIITKYLENPSTKMSNMMWWSPSHTVSTVPMKSGCSRTAHPTMRTSSATKTETAPTGSVWTCCRVVIFDDIFLNFFNRKCSFPPSQSTVRHCELRIPVARS